MHASCTKGHLLTVRAVAALLGVFTATVTGSALAERSPDVRVSNAIRVEPAEVQAFIARSERALASLPAVRENEPRHTCVPA